MDASRLDSTHPLVSAAWRLIRALERKPLRQYTEGRCGRCHNTFVRATDDRGVCGACEKLLATAELKRQLEAARKHAAVANEAVQADGTQEAV